jgi:hypothetical protein
MARTNARLTERQVGGDQRDSPGSTESTRANSCGFSGSSPSARRRIAERV